ncbi:MAG: hypothetical protein P4M05_19775 [Bradyrhizobium sp.]|nr:hypothetical protein [Bradyrhizobium sp.]
MLVDHIDALLVDHVDALRAAVVKTRERYPLTIDAVVVLPEYIHAVWTLPPDDADFSLRWRLIKSRLRGGGRGKQARAGLDRAKSCALARWSSHGGGRPGDRPYVGVASWRPGTLATILTDELPMLRFQICPHEGRQADGRIALAVKTSEVLK